MEEPVHEQTNLRTKSERGILTILGLLVLLIAILAITSKKPHSLEPSIAEVIFWSLAAFIMLSFMTIIMALFLYGTGQALSKRTSFILKDLRFRDFYFCSLSLLPYLLTRQGVGIFFSPYILNFIVRLILDVLVLLLAFRISIYSYGGTRRISWRDAWVLTFSIITEAYFTFIFVFLILR